MAGVIDTGAIGYQLKRTYPKRKKKKKTTLKQAYERIGKCKS